MQEHPLVTMRRQQSPKFQDYYHCTSARLVQDTPMLLCHLTRFLLLISAVSATALEAPPTTPNVVIIYGDDVGYGDVGVYGSTLIPTPHIDQLATEGLRFTDAHCSAATCTPSRYSLLTGEMAFRKEGTGIARGTANMIIHPDQFTLPDLFKKSGYQTAVIGKWHLGLGLNKPVDWNQKIEPGPESIGFDYHFIFPATNDRTPCIYIENGKVVKHDPNDPITVSYGDRIPDSAPGTKYPDARLNPEAITAYKGDGYHSKTVINGLGRIGYMKGGKNALFKDETITDVFVKQAKQFITNHKDQAFFLFFSANDIHAPRWPHERFRGVSKAGHRGDAMVSFDWSVGQLLKHLEDNGLSKNTIVIVTSDNGPVYIDGGYQDGSNLNQKPGDNHHAAAGVFRGGKYSIYEGGTRVPTIVRWPENIEVGVSKALFTQVDLIGSFAALLKQSIPGNQACDSRDELDTLMGTDSSGAEIILEQAKTIAIRQENWKYIEKTGELFHLKKDPSESQDLANTFKDKATSLKKLLEHYKSHSLTSPQP